MKYLFVLGNGFSIDLFNHLKKLQDYPLGNLFAYGDKLRWPSNGKNAFISFKNTPNLWLLGVRSSNSAEKNSRIIENIITCANAIHMKKGQSQIKRQNMKGEMYRNAYKELVWFLKFLFIQFDEEIRFSPEDIQEWHWAKLLKKISEDETVEEVNIITFNYDLWIEKILSCLDINYKTTVIENGKEGKFSITKPHGSISFIHKASSDITEFNINYNNEISILEGKDSDFEYCMNDLRRHSPITPLIPPAGDSGRFQLTWAGKLRSEASKLAGEIGKDDRVVLCGLSYWHVDRNEIDEILLNLNSQCEISYINPNPPEVLDAVLTSLFDNYEHYTNAERFAGGQYV